MQAEEWPDRSPGDLMSPKVLHEPGVPVGLARAWIDLGSGEIDPDDF